MQSYRALEKQLGIGPLPVSINEYSGVGHINVEGQPGASAPLIAKFERLGVDSASISFWDVGPPGRLGSLMASNTEPNGGWWFYKWYGDMAGTMVSTTPPSPASATALDGFANLDTTGRSASVLVGGVNDGAIQIVVKGFKAASFFGATVHAVVEHTRFVNRTTVVNATDTVSTNDLAVANDQITVSVTGANSTDGYRLRLTTVGGGGGASGGSGGGAEVGGSGGSAEVGGGSSTGGAGQAGAGGASTVGGAGTFGGQSGAAGALALGGASGGGNTGGVAGMGGSASTTDPGSNASDAAGCGCRVGRTSNGPGRPASFILSLLFAWRLTRRRRRDGRAGSAS
jgi:hypothetical protein